MDLIRNLIILLGGVGTISGLFWGFQGILRFLAGRKNDNPSEEDKGISGIIVGAVAAAASAGIAGSIINQLSKLQIFG